MLDTIVEDADKSDFHEDLWLVVTSILEFSGFLHFSELICFRPCNFEISQEMMKVRILQSKTDQPR